MKNARSAHSGYVWGRRLAAVVAGTATVLFMLTSVIVFLSRGDPYPAWSPWAYSLADPALLLLLVVPAVVVAVKRPANPVGWLLLLSVFAMALLRFTQMYGRYAMARDLPGDWAAAWISSWAFVLVIHPILLALVLIPDGRLPSPRWRKVAWFIGGSAGVIMMLGMFCPVLIGPYFFGLPNAFGIAVLAPVAGALGWLSAIFILCPALLAMAALLHRFRTSVGASRQQMKWVAMAVLADVPLVLINAFSTHPTPQLLTSAAIFHVFYTGITIALVRHRLFNIDQILSRSLLFTGLTATVVGLYALIVGGVGLLLHQAVPALPLVATGMIAILFQPLRTRLQHGINRLVYGERDDPHLVLSRLGERLDNTVNAEAVLPSVVDTVAATLKLPYVAVELRDENGSERVAATGNPSGQLLRLDLTHQGRLLGHLVCAPRSGEERLSTADRRVLADVARHAGAAAHAIQLATALRHSHQLLIDAREKERRRLRRDLHDGFGPALAAVVLQLDVAKSRLEHEPEIARRLLTEVRQQVKQTIQEIRRIAYELRPPVLDELGFLGALREQIGQMQPSASQEGTQAPAIRLRVPAALPDLPQAVQTAAFRIVMEALTNVVRHARARTCTVTLTVVGDDLDLKVCDDGCGRDDGYQPGVGVTSMRERAVELGGTFTISALSDAGTCVHARLPLRRTHPHGNATDPDR